MRPERALLLAMTLSFATAACASPDLVDGLTQADEPLPEGEDGDAPGGVGGDDGAGGAGSKGARDPAPRPRDVHSIACLGDSISQAFDAEDREPVDLFEAIASLDSVFQEMPALSWFQGTDPRIGSVASHYREKDPALVVTPLSVSGAELVDGSSKPNLEQQARAIAEAGASPDLVYVMLGGNDVCNREPSKSSDPAATMYSLDVWRAGIARGLAALVEVLPARATARFLSVPRVDLLYDAAADMSMPYVMRTPFGDLEDEIGCSAFWALAATAGEGVCRIITMESSPGRRRAIGERIDEYNRVLAEEVRRFGADASKNSKGIFFESDWHGSIDEGAEPDSSLGTFRFQSSHVTRRDCYHPSIAGQQELARLILHRARFSR
jgi:lysophospholipase L1-like esterase